MGKERSERIHVTPEQSWTHALALRAFLDRFAQLQRLHEEPNIDEDRYFIALAEFVIWAAIVDEANELVLSEYSTPSGLSYKQLKERSVDGQHVIAATWARNKITHCVARPAIDRAGVLGNSFVLGESTLGPDYRWLDWDEIVTGGIHVERKYSREPFYDQLFAGKPVYETLLPCIRWLSEVRYHQPDSNWVERWFEWQGG